MGFIRERVSYLKGLAEGLKIDSETNEGKMLSAIVEVLDDVVLAVEDIEDIQDEMEEHMGNMDEDLAEVESVIFGEECEDDFVTEVECPHCNETVDVFEDMLDEDEGSFECPKCEKEVDIEWDCCCEE